MKMRGTIVLNKEDTIKLLKECTKQNVVDVQPQFKTEGVRSERQTFAGLNIVVEQEVDIGLNRD